MGTLGIREQGGQGEGKVAHLPADPSLAGEEDVFTRGRNTCCTPWVVFSCFKMGNVSYLFVAHAWGDAHEPAWGFSPSKQTHFLERRFLFTAGEIKEPGESAPLPESCQYLGVPSWLPEAPPCRPPPPLTALSALPLNTTQLAFLRQFILWLF